MQNDIKMFGNSILSYLKKIRIRFSSMCCLQIVSLRVFCIAGHFKTSVGVKLILPLVKFLNLILKLFLSVNFFHLNWCEALRRFCVNNFQSWFFLTQRNKAISEWVKIYNVSSNKQ